MRKEQDAIKKIKNRWLGDLRITTNAIRGTSVSDGLREATGRAIPLLDAEAAKLSPESLSTAYDAAEQWLDDAYRWDRTTYFPDKLSADAIIQGKGREGFVEYFKNLVESDDDLSAPDKAAITGVISFREKSFNYLSLLVSGDYGLGGEASDSPKNLLSDEEKSKKTGKVENHVERNAPAYRAVRNNNPVNLKVSSEGVAKSVYGGIGMDEDNFIKFDSVEAWVKATKKYVESSKEKGLTVGEFVANHAPPTENDTNNYLDSVTKSLRDTPDTHLKDIPTNKIVKTLAMMEV